MGILNSIKRGFRKLTGKTTAAIEKLREEPKVKRENLALPAGIKGNQMLMGRVEARLSVYGRIVLANREARKQAKHNENQRLRSCEHKSYERKLALRQRAALA